MNRILIEHYELFRLYQRLRAQLMERLYDSDLEFSPGGANPSLGQLCVEIGDIQQAYIDSFRTFRLTFDSRRDDPATATSVERLKLWYSELDAALYEALAALTDEEIAGRRIDRGHGFEVSPGVQLEIYKEALLIFYGKVSVYMKALGREISDQWDDWIA